MFQFEPEVNKLAVGLIGVSHGKALADPEASASQQTLFKRDPYQQYGDAPTTGNNGLATTSMNFNTAGDCNQGNGFNVQSTAVGAGGGVNGGVATTGLQFGNNYPNNGGFSVQSQAVGAGDGTNGGGMATTGMSFSNAPGNNFPNGLSVQSQAVGAGDGTNGGGMATTGMNFNNGFNNNYPGGLSVQSNAFGGGSGPGGGVASTSMNFNDGYGDGTTQNNGFSVQSTAVGAGGNGDNGYGGGMATTGMQYSGGNNNLNADNSGFSVQSTAVGGGGPGGGMATTGLQYGGNNYPDNANSGISVQSTAVGGGNGPNGGAGMSSTSMQFNNGGDISDNGFSVQSTAVGGGGGNNDCNNKPMVVNQQPEPVIIDNAPSQEPQPSEIHANTNSDSNVMVQQSPQSETIEADSNSQANVQINPSQSPNSYVVPPQTMDGSPPNMGYSTPNGTGTQVDANSNSDANVNVTGTPDNTETQIDTNSNSDANVNVAGTPDNTGTQIDANSNSDAHVNVTGTPDNTGTQIDTNSNSDANVNVTGPPNNTETQVDTNSNSDANVNVTGPPNNTGTQVDANSNSDANVNVTGPPNNTGTQVDANSNSDANVNVTGTPDNTGTQVDANSNSNTNVILDDTNSNPSNTQVQTDSNSNVNVQTTDNPGDTTNVNANANSNAEANVKTDGNGDQTKVDANANSNSNVDVKTNGSGDQVNAEANSNAHASANAQGNGNGQGNSSGAGQGKCPAIVGTYCRYNVGAVQKDQQYLLPPEKIDLKICDNIAVEYAFLDKDQLLIKPSSGDCDLDLYKKVGQLQKPTFLTLGSYVDSGESEKYLTLFKNEDATKKFIENTIKSLQEWGFHGLELCYIWPTAVQTDPNRGTPDEKVIYLEFVKKVHSAFSQAGLLLIVDIPWQKDIIDKGFDLRAMQNNADALVMLTYDFGGSWMGRTGIFENLKPTGCEADNRSIDTSVQYVLQLGVQPCKLLITLGTIARTFTLNDENQKCVGAQISKGGPGGPELNAEGALNYIEACVAMNSNWAQPNVVSSYVDVKEAAEIALYARNNKLAGVCISAVDGDDSNQLCNCGASFPLTRTVHEIWNGANQCSIGKDCLDANKLHKLAPKCC